MSAERVLYRHLTTMPYPLLRRWFQNADIDLGELPVQVVGVRETSVGNDKSERNAVDWIGRRREELTTALLQTIDASDEDIAELLTVDLLPDTAAYDLDVHFEFAVTPSESEQTADAVDLAQLAVAASLYMEMYLAVAAAHRPLGFMIPPPVVSVQHGSVQFTTSGALLPVAVGILIATGAGAIALPLGLAGGGALAVAGLYETYLGWQRTIAERGKLDAEATKLQAEAEKLRAEATNLRAETDRINRTELDPSYVKAVAPSSAVQQDRIQEIASQMNASPAYVAHVLNRALPTYFSVHRYATAITYEMTEVQRPKPEPERRAVRKLNLHA